jgi:hypothetical protein
MNNNFEILIGLALNLYINIETFEVLQSNEYAIHSKIASLFKTLSENSYSSVSRHFLKY